MTTEKEPRTPSRALTLRTPADGDKESRTKRRDRSDTLARWLEADDLAAVAAIAFPDFNRAHHVPRLLIVSHVGGRRQRMTLAPDTDDELRRTVEQWFSGGDNALSRLLRDDPVQSDDRLGDLISMRTPLAQAGFTRCTGIETGRETRYVVFWSSDDPNDTGDGEHDPVRHSPLWRHLVTTLVNMARMEDLRDLSHTDAITGIFNRRHFDVRLSEEIARARRFGRPLSLLILDLDNFKQVNDSFGHLAGDRVLRQVATFIKKSVRSIDVFCRLGGDEFAVLMPDTGSEECDGLAARLGEAVASKKFRSIRKTADLTITISIGGAVFPDHAGREDRLVACADQALMDAKRAGRNRFILHEPDSLGDSQDLEVTGTIPRRPLAPAR
ncbi:MAG: GGDEF domain-containing protein [Candidatus Zixiibacteriota bacterium]